MIAKHIPMRQLKKSNFRQLVEYLNNPQSKLERVGVVVVTNCHQDNALDAALEIQATQALNTRTKVDKTYHLIISFRAGEQPTDDVLASIEAQMCTALGYGEHQRISTVHHDTDNLHIHVAINKIHPTHYTVHTPYNDYKVLSRICEKLEQEYGLETDNHIAQKTGSENRANDMERHAGVESLLSWIRRECSGKITAATTWAELHQILDHHGLKMSERGNGLAVTDTNGISVKASSIDRKFSKGKLEAKLGPFKSSTSSASKSTRGKQYDKRPVYSKKLDTDVLYAKYRDEQKNLGATRQQIILQARLKKERHLKAAKQRARLKRASIKLMTGPGVNKKLLYTLASKSLCDELAVINSDYLNERSAAYDAFQHRSWADWLNTKATEGDSEALTVLRAREARKEATNTVTGDIQKPGPVPGLKLDSITKAGTIIYRVGSTAVRDDGNQLSVTRGANRQGVEAVLRMAIYRYGSHLTINGSAEFKERIARMAVAANLKVTFADPATESRRQELYDELTAKTYRQLKRSAVPGLETEFTPTQASIAGAFHEDALSEHDVTESRPVTPTQADTEETFDELTAKTYRQLKQSAVPGRETELTPTQASIAGAFYEDALSERDAVESRPAIRTQSTTEEDTDERTRSERYTRGNRHRSGHSGGTGSTTGIGAGRGSTGAGRLGTGRFNSDQPDIGRPGRKPPPASRHRLRTMSQLDVVHLGNRSEVLLPGHVPNHLEHTRTERVHGVRRPVHGRGGMTAAQLAADKYITERQEKKRFIFDISNNRRYNKNDAGPVLFAGLRQIDGESVALLRRHEDVIVLPVDAATARFMKRLALGNELSLTAQGTIKRKGRSR